MTVNEVMRRTTGGRGAGGEGLDPVATEGPNLTVLLEEWRLAYDSGQGEKYLGLAEDIRYNRWAGQSTDGLKHQKDLPEGQRALPWDKSADTRISKADDLIGFLVDLLVTSFWNARMVANPVHASRMSAEAAGELRKVLNWLLSGALRAKLAIEVELAAQVAWTFGHVYLHPCWETKLGMGTEKLTMAELVAMAEAEGRGAGGEGGNGNGGMVESGNVGPWNMALRAVQDPLMAEQATEFLLSLFPKARESDARTAVKELRETGEAVLPVPEVISNLPSISVLIPYVDIIGPKEKTDVESSRLWFVRRWFTEALLEAEAAAEGWSEEWVKLAKASAGEKSDTQDAVAESDENNRLIEVVYGYARQVGQGGVPGIYLTVFCPAVQETYAVHELVDYAHGCYPLVGYQTEVTSRRMEDARGVPNMIGTSQTELKTQRDALLNLTQISTLPPLTKRGPRASKLPPELGPAGIIHMQSEGEWQWFPPPPGKPELAFQLFEKIDNETDQRFGKPGETTPPMLSQVRQQRIVNNWLIAWGEAFWQMACLVYQYLDPAELEELLGRPPVLTARDVARHRITPWFDVRSMDRDWLLQLVQAFNQFVLPADAGGVVDRAKYVRFILAYFDPTLADELTLDQQGASSQIRREVANQIMGAFNGNPPEIADMSNDPTAPAKLNYAKQILLQNPRYLVALDPAVAQQVLGPQAMELGMILGKQVDPLFSQHLEAYFKNLTQGAVQQQNKVVGRTGVGN